MSVFQEKDTSRVNPNILKIGYNFGLFHEGQHVQTLNLPKLSRKFFETILLNCLYDIIVYDDHVMCVMSF